MALCYRYSSTGHFIGVESCNPRRLPRNCTLKPPPIPPPGFVAVWEGDRWALESKYLAKLAISDHHARTRWFRIPWALSTALKFLTGNHEDR